MAKISVLDKHLAELIAAGEVVERPASALKEMVENSIDSGANAITVEIKNGGNTYMRVTDNGCGIDKDDVRTAFLRHATSKIHSQDDLNHVMTLGFRGEALASIGAVAKVEIITRTADTDFGVKYIIHGGEEIEFTEAGTAEGTTIVVRDLFYNTPARMKFLKKDNTEANVVTAMMQRIAISHPEISFKLIRDGKQVMNTPGDGLLRSAIFTVFGREFADSLIPVDYTQNGVHVYGFTGRPTESRKNRSMQFFFLNSRNIRTKTGIAALEQAYKNSIMIGTYPTCVLFIDIDPELVDVNVHPAKIEVRFSDEQLIFSAVYYAVLSAVNADTTRVEFTDKRVSTAPSYDRGEQIKFDTRADTKRMRDDFERRALSGEFTKDKPERKVAQYDVTAPIPDVHHRAAEFGVFDTPAPSRPVVIPNIIITNDEPQSDAPMKNDAASADILDTVEQGRQHIDFRYVGQAFDTYIIVEVGSKLVLIDKHAAHERILFNKLRSEAKFEPQMLISPVSVPLSAPEYDAVLTNLDRINDYGFEIDDFGMNTVLVRAVPVYLDGEDVTALTQEIAGKLINKNTDFTPEFIEWLFHNVACRSAIKAGNRSSEMELRELADIVLNDDSVRYCPHGRPVAAELADSEIKRRFSRI